MPAVLEVITLGEAKLEKVGEAYLEANPFNKGGSHPIKIPDNRPEVLRTVEQTLLGKIEFYKVVEGKLNKDPVEPPFYVTDPRAKQVFFPDFHLDNGRVHYGKPTYIPPDYMPPINYFN